MKILKKLFHRCQPETIEVLDRIKKISVNPDLRWRQEEEGLCEEFQIVRTRCNQCGKLSLETRTILIQKS